MKNLLMAGNSTMPRQIGIFNLPALKTCTPSVWCAHHCYATKRRYVWSNVVKAYQWRYQQSLRSDFIERMIKEIQRRSFITMVRPHISGDFYSEKYVRKWAEIADRLPQIAFRVTTKRQDFLPLMYRIFPSNIILRESIDNSRQPLLKDLVALHAVAGTLGSENYFKCINNCEKCKFQCWINSKMNVVSEKIL